MRNVWLMAQFSLSEMIRRKILPILGVMTVGFFVLFDFAISQQASIQGQGNTVSNFMTVYGDKVLAAFFISLFIGFMAIFIVSGAITPEVDNGTLLVIQARPLKRWELVLGKWAGMALIQLIIIPVLVLTTSGILQSHFPHQTIPAGSLIQTILAFWGEGWILSLLALSGSIFLSQVANGVMIGLAFIINFILGSIAQASQHSLVLKSVSQGLNLLMPTSGLYQRALFEWVGGSANPLLLSVMGPFGVSHPPASSIFIYAALYAALILALSFRWYARLDF